MSRNSSVTGLLSLGDRVYGAWLGAQVASASDLGPETLDIRAMLLRYEPFGAPAPQPAGPLFIDRWTERILHQQLSGVRRETGIAAIAAIPGSKDPTLELAWQLFCQDLPWEIAFKLMELAAAGPSQRAALGLWLGAALGPRAIPLGRLSPEVIRAARSRSRQFFLTWSGCDEREAVGVS
ncbi:MAG: hypothetical protein HC771_08735 [Synechococcales cyanobacterium CRU_2_2]|nr:hypothetical protein [Synechococcales cyanobacterium CRU_2_2]